MNSPLLSVVTVTYNDAVGVTRTLDSLKPLLDQGKDAISVHVIDGGSGKDFIQSLASYAGAIDLVSESDQGIYDAMNKGVARSRGKYVWFLNGGDECRIHDWIALKTLLNRVEDRMIFCSYETGLVGRNVARRPRSNSYIRHALPTSHQAIFYPNDALSTPAYDLEYQVAGDYHLTASLMAKGIQTLTSDLVVSHFGAAGWSAVHGRRLIFEAGRVQREVLKLGRAERTVSKIHHGISQRVQTVLTWLNSHPVS